MKPFTIDMHVDNVTCFTNACLFCV